MVVIATAALNAGFTAYLWVSLSLALEGGEAHVTHSVLHAIPLRGQLRQLISSHLISKADLEQGLWAPFAKTT